MFFLKEARVSNALNNILGPNATSFIALNNNRCYDYPSQVIFEIEQENLGDYFQAASLVNFSDVNRDEIEEKYASLFTENMGNVGNPARMTLGALIIQ